MPSGTSPSSPLVAVTSTTRCPWAASRAMVPAVAMASSSGWAWKNTAVAIGREGYDTAPAPGPETPPGV